MNPYGTEEGKYRLLPRTADRSDLFALFDEKPRASLGNSRISLAYEFFLAKIDKFANSTDSLNSLFAAVTSRLSLAEITLVDENPFEIFETLNGKGMKLEQSDLIKNYIFMDVDLQTQDEFENRKWQPFEVICKQFPDYKAGTMTAFYRDCLMSEGRYVKKNEVYQEFKDDKNLFDSTPDNTVAKLLTFAEHYSQITTPARVGIPSLRRELEVFAQLKISTANPLLLAPQQWRRRQLLSDEDFRLSIRAIGSLIIRRSVGGLRTRGYGDQFPDAIRFISEGVEKGSGDIFVLLVDYLESLGWPNDREFTDSLVRFQLYQKDREITKALLLGVECSHLHRESPDVFGELSSGRLQIEHIMPQAIKDDAKGDAWKAALGEEWEEIHRTLKDTLGNLTLTAYNPELSNESFQVKRDEWFQASNIAMNREIAEEFPLWNRDSIVQRALSLAKTIIEIWPASDTAKTRTARRLSIR